MLYNKGKLNQIVSWEIEIEGGKYRAITGQLNGKKTTSEWTICKGKNIGKSNETTPEEQAIKEVAAKVKKKLEEGYVENIEELENKSGQVQEVVMLAEKYKDFESSIDDDEDLYVQPKLDGIRSKFTKEHILISRKNKPFNSVPHIINEANGVSFELDGELYNHDLYDDFNQIVSIVKKIKPTPEDLEISKNIIRHYVYDCFIEGKFSERYKALEELFEKNKFKYLVLVPTYKCKKAEINKYHDMFVELGYEGIIIRRDKPYEYFRSKNLLKLKNWIDEEYEILDIEEGIGNRSGMMGRIKLKINDTHFYSNAKGTFAYYRDLLNNKDQYIGKFATVKYQNLTPDNVPRFGQVISIRDYE